MSLKDGAAAHAADHNHWSRRQFLSGASMMAAGGMIFGSSPLLSWASPLLTALTEDSDNDRILVLVRLKGGNDGLNTIVPFGDNRRRILYEGLRPKLKIDCNNLLPLQVGGVDSEFALPNYAQEMHDMWHQNGNMAVIHNVGAANQNGSHFLGSDLMTSGANNTTQYADVRKSSGWMGRYFDQTLPAFLGAPPTTPPVIQIGVSNNLIFRGAKGTPYDLVFSDLAAFEEVLLSGQLYNTGMFGDDPTCTADIERTFVRNVANSTLRYAKTVQQAYYNVPGYGCYEDDGLSQQLKKVGRLIKGGLKTKVYMVSWGDFDTHSNQGSNHPDLIQALSKAVSAFHEDLGAEHGDRVLTMTFSEFGRTVVEKGTGSGSEGTDHGTLAPVMLFGNAVTGQNFYGTPIDLSPDKIDSKGLIHFADKTEGGVDIKGQTGAIDFRHVYEKVMRDWLCVDGDTVENVLLRRPGGDANHDYEDCNSTSMGSDVPDPTWPPSPPHPLSDCKDVVTTASTPGGCDDPLGGMIIGGCHSTVSQSSTLDAYVASLVTLGYNIKQSDSTKVEIKYATKMDANVKLEILESNGGKVAYNDGNTGTELRPLVEKYQEAGSYTYEFDSQPEIEGNPTTILNTNTKYICRLEINGMTVERTLIIH